MSVSLFCLLFEENLKNICYFLQAPPYLLFGVENDTGLFLALTDTFLNCP